MMFLVLVKGKLAARRGRKTTGLCKRRRPGCRRRSPMKHL
jgi:hypothetical protein